MFFWCSKFRQSTSHTSWFCILCCNLFPHYDGAKSLRFVGSSIKARWRDLRSNWIYIHIHMCVLRYYNSHAQYTYIYIYIYVYERPDLFRSPTIDFRFAIRAAIRRLISINAITVVFYNSWSNFWCKPDLKHCIPTRFPICWPANITFPHPVGSSPAPLRGSLHCSLGRP